ncbi:hypothetical protein JI735_33775 (plasmid) [Paenibacillus sonchi]|uniref:Uncharacterized protein n=1 Tax=Paenibacillus sonchi TaxID=373687 RepID=A0A974PIL2_9BACL|nr:hypothetical protein [Paenibacillus sonchi]QQZ64622.1 hypothetical protein JI735_33775 [Paenibacillus sonchi]
MPVPTGCSYAAQLAVSLLGLPKIVPSRRCPQPEGQAGVTAASSPRSQLTLLR